MWEHSISNEENLSLCAVPTENEVKDTLWAMHLLKAPGPDGMPGIFFTFYCSIVGPQVVRFVQDYFQNGVLLKAMNFTNLVLIPKSAGAATFANFRPISLCNVTYKIISKLLANRLRTVLDRLISPYQSAFIPGRSITENIVIAQEIIQNLK